MSGFLESLHLYRKVPKDLTDGTRLGGALSLVTAAVMLYLLVSNVRDYMSLRELTDVALDDSSEAQMRIYFNITMERLPCQFASVDVSDVMGTSLSNVTQNIVKFKVGAAHGHKTSEYYPEVTNPTAIIHEELLPSEIAEIAESPVELPALDDSIFESFIKQHDLVLVTFGAPWCPWSQRLEPVWKKTWAALRDKPYARWVRMGRVDCTSHAAQATCQKHHIHAFPTIRIYRHRQSHSHENYLGDRTSEAFIAFIEEALPRHLQGIIHPEALPTPPTEASKHSTAAESTSLDGEGCQLTGWLHISRVPGSFRISSQSDSHSFNTRVMNVSHHVDKLLFGYLDESPRRLQKILTFDQRSSLFQVSFMMHQQLATLKHYLKVVPFHHHALDGEVTKTYMYKANYNEYRPRKLEWYEGKADAHVDTQLVPNAVFHYDISPVKVVTTQETQGFANFVTKICAVIGGIYTVVGLFDNVLYHGGQAAKKLA